MKQASQIFQLLYAMFLSKKKKKIIIKPFPNKRKYYYMICEVVSLKGKKKTQSGGPQVCFEIMMKTKINVVRIRCTLIVPQPGIKICRFLHDEPSKYSLKMTSVCPSQYIMEKKQEASLNFQLLAAIDTKIYFIS